MLGSGRTCLVDGNELQPSSWLQYQGECCRATPAKPEMNGFPLRFFVKRCGVLVTGRQRNRNDLKLEQTSFRKRMQRPIATFIYASSQHLRLRLGDLTWKC